MSGPLLIHLHIPKNAGTTLSRMLKVGILMRPPTNVFNRVHVLGYYPVVPWERRIERMNALPETRRTSVKFFEAHCGYGVQDLLPSPSRTITLVREPVDRTLSVYSFLKQTGVLKPDVPLASFLDQPPPDRVWWVDNAQVRYLAGEKGQIDARAVGTCTEKMLDVAKSRAAEQIEIVGLVERYEESAVLIRRMLGWGPGPSIRSNITKGRTGADGADLARIQELNTLDTQFHRFCAELFERKVQDAGRAFSDAVARSRRSSRAWSDLLGDALERRTLARRKRRRARSDRSP